MLSLSGIVAKQLKKQDKLPEKYEDLAMEPVLKNTGKCYYYNRSSKTWLEYTDLTKKKNICALTSYIYIGKLPNTTTEPVDWSKDWEFTAKFYPKAITTGSSYKTAPILAAPFSFVSSGEERSGNIILYCYPDGSCKINEGIGFKEQPIPASSPCWVRIKFTVSSGLYQHQYSLDGKTFTTIQQTKARKLAAKDNSFTLCDGSDRSSLITMYLEDVMLKSGDTVVFYREP